MMCDPTKTLQGADSRPACYLIIHDGRGQNVRMVGAEEKGSVEVRSDPGSMHTVSGRCALAGSNSTSIHGYARRPVKR